MQPVSALYNKYPGSEIYVIGTGPSMRVFPVEMLRDKITIGLNMAWKNAPVRYCVTIHPDLNVPEFMPGEQPRPDITWVTKRAKSQKLLTPEQFAHADAHFYAFEERGKQFNTAPAHDPANHSRVVEWLKEPVGDYLYCWSSISQTGMNLAANMGAKTIYLIGCDNGDIGENHHAHNQHTRWKGVAPDYRYNQYYEGNCEVRDALAERGITVLTLSPFMGLKHVERDFAHLCERQGKAALITAQDVSPPRAPFHRKVVKRVVKRVRRLKESVI